MTADAFGTVPRTVRVERSLGFDTRWLRLAALDDEGALCIWVDLTLWEDLRLSAPDWSDTDDRRAYALAEVERRAGLLLPFRTEDGRLVTLD